MELGLIAGVGIIVLVGVSILGSRIGVAAPLLLVVVGIVAGYLPFVPLIHIEPEYILLGVLPPLLYSAAVNVPLIDFRRNIRPVVGLSVVLVIISAVVTGAVLHLFVPSIPFPVAFAVGAVISPPDAVAATAIGKRLGLPERVVSILEGESLVNDATALVLLKTAFAAIAGSFVFWEAAGTFAYSVTAALAVGLIAGVVTVWIRSKLNNPVYDTMISFVVPFVAFVPAEMLEASGVLSVVITGLYTGHHASRRFSATARMNERLNWRTLQFALENGVFLVMGLQLHALVEEIAGSRFRLLHIAFLALSLVAVLIICRTLFMIPMVRFMRSTSLIYKLRFNGFSRIAQRARGADAPKASRVRRAELMQQRSRADLAHSSAQRIGWREGAVLSWSGMRGVVTLAAAQSIPLGVPYRAQLILIAFGVAVTTLLLHGLTLPLFVRKLWPSGAHGGASKGELVALSTDLIEAANDAIDDALANEAEDDRTGETPPEIIERVRASARNALATVTLSLPPTGPIEVQAGESPAQRYLRLTRLAIDAQRAALLEERAIGRYSSHALRTAERALDAYEARLSASNSN